jgi:tRNA threonylcarbamoyladenosine modification (KEOPS) complex Cgi121 subunit
MDVNKNKELITKENLKLNDLKIAAFRGVKDIKSLIEQIKKDGYLITLIDLEKIEDIREIYHAAILAELYFQTKPIANKIENEFLIRLSGKRQILDAIKEYGAKNNKDFLIVFFKKTNIEEFAKKYNIEFIGFFYKKIEDELLFKKLEQKVFCFLE